MNLFGIFFRFLFFFYDIFSIVFYTELHYSAIFFSSVTMTAAQVLIPASSLAPNDVVKSNQKTRDRKSEIEAPSLSGKSCDRFAKTKNKIRKTQELLNQPQSEKLTW